MAVFLPSTTPFILPAAPDASTVADLKARASAVCGVPAAHLLVFAASPLSNTATVEPTQTLHLAVGAQPPSTDAPSWTPRLDAAAQPPLLGMYADHRILVETVRRMQTGLALGEEGTEAAELQLRGASEAAREAAAALMPRVEVAELQQTLRATERRADEASRRVKELERQLAEAQRSLSRQQDAPALTARVAQPDAAAPPPPSEKPAALPVPAAAVKAQQPSPPSNCDITDLITSIRREKASDLTVDVPPELAVAVEALRGALHRSLALLSEDLYRDDVHAVSELLQNADDNAYAPGTDPAWALHCSSTGGVGGAACAWTVNNELGMTERDVRALCDAGNSSKRGVAGNIGRKGVGFKSCFKLSAAPHVLSAGFAFRFDLAANGLLGYILPERIDESALAALPEAARRAWRDDKKTVVYLPLRAEAPDVRAMRSALRQRASSLFFLRRLRKLKWVDSATRDVLHFSRVHLEAVSPAAPTPAPTTEAAATTAVVAATAAAADPEGAEAWQVSVEELRCVQHEGGVQTTSSWRFLRCAATLRVPTRLRAEAPADTTEVVLVLPLRGGGATGDAPCDGAVEGRPTEEVAAVAFASQVHCFLPIRDVGLRFALHADFSLTSSRDDVHDCAWNRWLRDAVPPLLVAAVAAQPTGSAGSSSGAASMAPSPALAFLPPGGARLAEPFWQPLADGAVRELRSSRLPVLCSESGELCALGALRLRPPCVSRELVSNETLRQCLGGVQFASAGGADSEAGSADEEMLRAMGVRAFGLADLAACVHALGATRVGPPPTHWLTELYASLHELCKSHGGGLQEASRLVRSLPILPLKAATSRTAGEPRRSLAAAVDGPVFTTLPAVAWASAAELEKTLPQLRLLSVEMVEQLTTAEAGARRLMQALDVRAATPTDLLDHALREHESAAVCGVPPTSSDQVRKQRLLDQLRLVRRLHEAGGELTEGQQLLLMVPTWHGAGIHVGIRAAADVTLERAFGGLVTAWDEEADDDHPRLVFCDADGDLSERDVMLEALRDERFLVEVLGARVHPGLNEGNAEFVFEEDDTEAGEAFLAGLLDAAADTRLRSYVQSRIEPLRSLLAEVPVLRRNDGKGASPAEDYQLLQDCFLAPAFAPFNSELPCINPPLPLEPGARIAVLDALRMIGVHVELTVDSCLAALLSLEQEHSERGEYVGDRRDIRRQLPLLNWLATHLQLASGEERTAAIKAIRESLGDCSEMSTRLCPRRSRLFGKPIPPPALWADMHGDGDCVVTCCAKSARWLEGTEAAKVALVLAVPNIALGYRSASALFAPDALDVVRSFTDEELCEALDALSDALMDTDLPKNDFGIQSHAISSLAITGPVEELHAVATYIYTCLADKGSDVLRSLDADFYDKRRIFVPAADTDGSLMHAAADQRPRFSTSEDVYWFAASRDEQLLAAACGLHALGPHYPTALKSFFAALNVPARPEPSTSRLLEAMYALAGSPQSESTASVVAECARRLAERDLDGVDGEGGGAAYERSDICPRHGPGCTHPACRALGQLYRARSGGAGGSGCGGGGGGGTDQELLRQTGAISTDAAQAQMSAQQTIQRALAGCNQNPRAFSTNGGGGGGLPAHFRGSSGPPGGPGQEGGGLGPGDFDGESHADHLEDGFDLVRIGRTQPGIPLYADRGLGWPADPSGQAALLQLPIAAHPSTAPLVAAADAFAGLLLFLARIVGLSPDALCVFYEPPAAADGSARREVIGFNSSGALWFSLRAFLSLHGRLPSLWVPECTVYWLSTLCHELAHNLTPRHDAAHEALLERLIERFVPTLVHEHVRQAQQQAPQQAQQQAPQLQLQQVPPYHNPRGFQHHQAAQGPRAPSGGGGRWQQGPSRVPPPPGPRHQQF